MTAGRTRVEGAAEIEAAMADLGKSLGKALLRRVAKAQLQPVIETARGILREGASDTGALADSLTVTTVLSKRQRKEAAREARANGKSAVEVYAGAGALRHAHLVELGTGPRVTRSGKSTGVMPPFPFMRRAWDAHKSRMTDSVGEAIWLDIERTLARRERRRAARGL